MLKAGKDESFSPDFLAMKEIAGEGYPPLYNPFMALYCRPN